MLWLLLFDVFDGYIEDSWLWLLVMVGVCECYGLFKSVFWVYF